MQLNPYSASNLPPSSYAEPVVSPWAVALFGIQGFINLYLVGIASIGPFPVPEELPYFASLIGLIGIPFVYALPTVKAGGMARHWGVPKTTLLISRPLLRFICSGVVGTAIGALLALPLVGLRFVPIPVSYALTAFSMTAATNRRFSRHPSLEWTMPPPGYKMIRSLLRGSRPDA